MPILNLPPQNPIKISNQIMELDKGQSKPKDTRRKKITKIRRQINKIEKGEQGNQQNCQTFSHTDQEEKKKKRKKTNIDIRNEGGITLPTLQK